MKPSQLTEAQAHAQGYRPLTTPYQINGSDKWMLENVVRDMERGGIDYLVVRLSPGSPCACVWRRGMTTSREHESAVDREFIGAVRDFPSIMPKGPVLQ